MSLKCRVWDFLTVGLSKEVILVTLGSEKYAQHFFLILSDIIGTAIHQLIKKRILRLHNNINN